ncbi:MAG: hypothetical protein NC831_02820 [Candidatus Omnitrophica bacterium]|nr:hypothetical protein [Candidatus Omnitrophota bacterium]
MKILFWILLAPLIIIGFFFFLALIFALLSLTRLKKNFLVVRCSSIHNSKNEKIVDAEWSEKRD